MPRGDEEIFLQKGDRNAFLWWKSRCFGRLGLYYWELSFIVRRLLLYSREFSLSWRGLGLSRGRIEFTYGRFDAFRAAKATAGFAAKATAGFAAKAAAGFAAKATTGFAMGSPLRLGAKRKRSNSNNQKWCGLQERLLNIPKKTEVFV